MGRAAWVAVVLAGGAFAQGPARVALVPIAAPGVDEARLVVELNREQRSLLGSVSRLAFVTAEEVDAALASQGGPCAAEGKELLYCLEHIAIITHATYAIGVTVKRGENGCELTATIAAADHGALEQPAPMLCAVDPGAEPLASLKAQLRVLLLDRLWVPPTVEAQKALPPRVQALKPKELVFPPPGQRPVPVTVDRGAIPRMWGRFVLAFGAASAICGAILLGIAANERGHIVVDARGNIPAGNEGLLDSTGHLQTTGGGLLGFGVLTSAAGGLLSLSATSAQGFAAAPLPGGGGAIFLRGELP